MRELSTPMALCIACVMGIACGSNEAPRTAAPRATSAPCADLVGRWREVEPTDETTIDEPKDDKVRPLPSGAWLTFEPARLTIVSATDRSESSVVVERAQTGACLLHARDSQGRPLDIEATLVSERLLRMHNIAEPHSPASLYERQ